MGTSIISALHKHCESASERILKIVKHLQKLWKRIKCPVFDSLGMRVDES